MDIQTRKDSSVLPGHLQTSAMREMAAEKEGKPGHGSGSPGLQECPCLPTLHFLQTDKEQLTTEAKELRQKVKYLQDQLSPLMRQREYQEKEIQRLNKVGTRTPPPDGKRLL